jgi:carbamoyl-phosphate synthase large subunit
VIDITDVDSTLRFAEANRIDGIVCDTTDVGVPTMAYVAERLGLAGLRYETALNYTSKLRMRQLTSKAGVLNPPFCFVETLTNAMRAARDIGFPCVVKPVDNQSSRGVHVVRAPSQLEDAYADAIRFTRAPGVLVEGFLDGIEVTVETFCSPQGVFAIGISDKSHFPHRPEVANRLTYPADLPIGCLARIREVNETVIRALGLRTGIAHAEYMVVGGEVYLVEIAARGAGSRVYSHIVPYLAEAPVPRMYLEYVMGSEPTFTFASPERSANLAFFSFEPGVVQAIEGLDAASTIPGVQEILLEFSVGDRLALPSDDRSRPGLVYVFGRTRDEVLRHTEQVFQTVAVRVQ